MSENPYAAPKENPIDSRDASQYETLRTEHLRYEAIIKTIGLIYLLAGAGIIGTTVYFYFDSSWFVSSLALSTSIILGISLILVGHGIGRLKKWARAVAVNISIFGLLLLPVGTILGIAALYFFFSKEGQQIFSRFYQDAICATPHLSYRISTIASIIVALPVLAGVCYYTMKIISDWGSRDFTLP